MKKLWILVLVALAHTGFAQITEGVITYEQKITMKNQKIVVNGQDMSNMMPKERIEQMQLFFSTDETLFKNAPGEEENVIEGGNGTMVFKMHRPQNELYVSLKEGKRADSREFMGKKFLIKGEVTQMPWKVTGEMEEVAGYTCLKATMTDTTPEGEARNIVAWFTSDIPVSAGPGKYGTLPGMILKLDINDGSTVYTATKIEDRPLETGEISEPKRGKEVTEEEYEAIVKEQLEKMKEQGGGKFMIRGN